MENQKPSWWKPAIENPAGSTCLCCPHTSEVLHLDTKLYLGFGGWIIYKNNQVFFVEKSNIEFDDSKDLNYVEAMIGNDDENEYVAVFDAPLRSAKYQRHAKNTWVLIERGEGFA